MSHPNSPSPKPNPLETEAFLEDSSSPAVDVVEVEAIAAESHESIDFAAMAIIPDGTNEQQETADGFLLARKLRQNNRELVQTVVQLEQALAESQARLQAQISRSRSADSLITQQADNISGTQAEIDHLKQELDRANQELREHRALVSQLKQEARRNQTHLAQVERECTLLQESYKEQQNKLIAAEQEIQDLQARLQRQQRYSMEYKIALEQQGIVAETTREELPQRPVKPMPKVSRIQPWSGQPSAVNPFPAIAKEETPEPLPNLEASVILPPDINEDLEQQLQALEVEMETMSQEVQQPMANPVIHPVVQFPTFATPVVSRTRTPQTTQVQPQAPSVQTKQPVLPTDKPAAQTSLSLPNRQNWPSPTLNPLRPAKKRSSLAAVDLPSFNRR